MRKQKLHILTSKVHKWTGLIVGIQVVLWIAGGLVMSWFDIENVRGEHLVAPDVHQEVTPASHSMSALETMLSAGKRPVRSWEANWLHGKPVFRIRYFDGGHSVYNAQSGDMVSPFGEAYVRELVNDIYQGSGAIKSVVLRETTGIEYRGPLPVWKVDFDDGDNTSFYVNPETGALTSIRTTLWRFYDFMWMLHIMDYETRNNFNHPLLYLFAFAALIFALSGVFLLFFRFHKRDFKWLMPAGK